MAFLAPILSAAIPALGGIFGNRPQTSTQGGTSQSNQGGTSMPVLSAEGAGAFQNLSDIFQGLKAGTDLSGYEASQAQGIANNSDIAKKLAIENLAAHGITTGAAPGTALTAQDSSRIAQMNQLHQQIPLIQNQLQSSLLNLGTNLFRALPEGTNTTGFQNTAQQGNVTQPGNILGGLFGNLNPSDLVKAIQSIGGLFGGGGQAGFPFA